MKRLIFCVLLISSVCSFAKDKSAVAYQDAVLVDFRTVDSGSSCSTTGNTNGTVNSTSDTTGTVNATTTASTQCVNHTESIYTLSLGGHVYQLVVAVNPARVATAMIPILGPAYLIATRNNSVLYGVLPGTHVQVRTEEGGKFFVKVGKRESKYKLVGAHDPSLVRPEHPQGLLPPAERYTIAIPKPWTIAGFYAAAKSQSSAAAHLCSSRVGPKWTVYHGSRFLPPAPASAHPGPNEKPAVLAGFSVKSLVALTGIEPVF